MSKESRLIDTLFSRYPKLFKRETLGPIERKEDCARILFSWREREERKEKREERDDDDGLLRVWKTDDTTIIAPKAFCAVVRAAAAFFFFFFFFCPREDVSASCNG